MQSEKLKTDIENLNRQIIEEQLKSKSDEAKLKKLNENLKQARADYEILLRYIRLIVLPVSQKSFSDGDTIRSAFLKASRHLEYFFNVLLSVEVAISSKNTIDAKKAEW